MTWFDVFAQMLQRVNGFVVALLICVTRVELRPTVILYYLRE